MQKKQKLFIIAAFIFALAIVLLLAVLNFSNREITFPQIPKPQTTNQINIVFTTDKQYSNYLKVALKSLILNKNKDSNYNIYILCIDLPNKQTAQYKTFERENVKINPIALKMAMLKGKINNKATHHHVSDADLFKFFIPEIFKDFDKILYLDSDILVLGDLSSLYNTDIENKYMALTRRYSYPVDLKEVRYNIGVILFNIKKCNEDNLQSKLLYIKNNDKENKSISQAAFNKALTPDMTVSLSPVYNNRTITTEKDFIDYNYKKNYAPFLNNINSLKELDEKTIIVHFAGVQKPWNNPDMKFAKEWFYYNRMIRQD